MLRRQGRGNDGILGKETAQRRDAGQRQRRQHKADEDERPVTPGTMQLRQSGGLAAVLKHACAEKQRTLDGRMGNQMQQCRPRYAGTHRYQHKTILAGGRSRQQPLEVLLPQGDEAGDDGGHTADHTHGEQCIGRQQRRGTDQQDGPGRHQRGRMQQGRDRCGTRHGAEQPTLQGRLCRLAHGRYQQQEPRSKGGRASRMQGGGNFAAAGRSNQDKNRRVETQVSRTRIEKGAGGSRTNLGALVPEADQQITAQPDELPGRQQQHPIASQHQGLHGGNKKRQGGKETRLVGILLHIADGIDQHKGAYDADHYGQERIERFGNQTQGHVRQAGQDQRVVHAVEGIGQQPQARNQTHARTQQGERSGRAARKRDQRCRRERREHDKSKKVHPFKSWASSISTDPLARKRAIATPKPTAISSAITVMTMSTNIWPA